MKLTLKNFRCYTHQTFEFDDDVITLISGPSGHGKTTILLGIQFALYGSTNHKYLVSHNKTGCMVELLYKNFKIKRTKRPNILNVEFDGKTFEDKEAQIILNKYFGVTNSSIFFMDLSTEQKMEFLEKIVNENCDVKELKHNIKTELSHLSKQLAILDGQITNTESMLSIIQKPEKVDKVDKTQFHLTDLTKEELETKKKEAARQLESELAKRDKCTGLRAEERVIRDEIASLGLSSNENEYKRKVDDLATALAELKDEHNKLNQLKDNFLIVQESIKELEKYKNIERDDVDSVARQIASVDADIQRCALLQDIQTLRHLQRDYEDALGQETQEHSDRTNSLRSQITSLGEGKGVPEDELSSLEQLYTNYKAAQNFNERHDLVEIEGQIAATKSKFFKKYVCHMCQHPFVINMDTFEMESSLHSSTTDEFESTSTINLKTKLKNLENLKDKFIQNQQFILSVNIDDVVDKIGLIKNKNKLIQKLEQLGPFKPSLSLIKMKKNIAKLKLSIPSLMEEEEEISAKDVNVLKDEKRDLTIRWNDLSQKLKMKQSLVKKVEKQKSYDASRHSKVIDLLEQYTERYNTEYQKFKNGQRLGHKLQLLNNEIDKLGYDPEKIPRLENLLVEIESGLKYHRLFDDYRAFQSQLKKYKKVKETLNEFLQSKNAAEQAYLKTLLFKQKVVEAEQESIQYIVDIINSHLHILLQDFFSESFGDPIQIYLELVSGKRPSVDTVINYKGNRIDYKSLSTGEYARVKLAFDLTFKEILGENIIMLDECTANLDQDLSTKIFNKIRDSFPSKTILVVAHQVVMGTFDHVLRV